MAGQEGYTTDGVSDVNNLCRRAIAARGSIKSCPFKKSGAGEGIRTLDPNLGKVVLYP